MLRKKLAEERRENAQKKKSADQASEPDNRITQNNLPEDTPIVASPPVYQDIYSRVPMLPMLPLPVFYNEANDGSGEADISPDAADFAGANGQQPFYPYPQMVDVEESSGALATEENALENAEQYAEQSAEQYEIPSEDESSTLLESEEAEQAYIDDASGSAANDIYEDAKSIEEGEGANNGKVTENEVSNRDDTTASAGASAPQGGGDQVAAQPGVEQPAVGQQPTGQQGAGQQPKEPVKPEEDKGNSEFVSFIVSPSTLSF